MPAKIPPALMPPTRPLTEAQKQALKTPTPEVVQILTPQQQAEIKQHQETLSKINIDLQNAQADLQNLQNQMKEMQVSGQVISPRTRTVFLQKQSALQTRVRNLEKIRNIAQTSLVSYEELKSYEDTMQAIKWFEQIVLKGGGHEIF